MHYAVLGTFDINFEESYRLVTNQARKRQPLNRTFLLF